MRRRSLLGAVLASAFAGCLAEPPGPDAGIKRTGTPSLDPEEAIKVLEHERREQGGLYYVIGILKNIGVEIHDVQVVVTWFDDGGSVLGKSISNEGLTLEPGRQRRFDTGLFDTEGSEPPARYELEVMVD